MERSLDIEVTRRCNLRCDYCFVGWSRDWHSDLPKEVAEQVIREGAGRFNLLHFTGGEPFAYRPLFELIELGLSLGYPAVLINSNGTMLSDAQIARLGSYGGRVALSISLDGPPEIHDKVRGAGRFAQSDATTTRLLDAGVPVTLMSVVTPAVLAVLPAFLRERAQAHPRLSGITLFPVGVGPSGTQKPGKELAALTPPDLHLLAVHVALAWHAGIRVTVGAYPMINPLLRSLGYPSERLYQCTAGRGRICIHADQGVSSCHPVKDPIYGRWESGLFERLEQHGVHRVLGERAFDGCKSCSHKEECGHCRAFVTASGAPILGNDRVCLDVVPGRRAELARTEAESQPAEPPVAPFVTGLISPAALVRHTPARPQETEGVQLVRRFAAVLESGNLEALTELLTDDCCDRDPVPLQPAGRGGVAYKLALWRAMKPRSRSRFLHIAPTQGGVTARWRTEPGDGEAPGVFEGRFTTQDGRISAFEVDLVG